jgi:hypothetical protein
MFVPVHNGCLSFNMVFWIYHHLVLGKKVIHSFQVLLHRIYPLLFNYRQLNVVL